MTAGASVTVGLVLVLLGSTVWNDLFAVVWPAAGWMIAIGIIIGGLSGAASLLEGRKPSR